MNFTRVSRTATAKKEVLFAFSRVSHYIAVVHTKIVVVHTTFVSSMFCPNILKV